MNQRWIDGENSGDVGIQMVFRWHVSEKRMKLERVLDNLNDNGSHRRRSAKLPSVTAVIAEDESGHRFISRSCLQLIVRAVAFAASPTLKGNEENMLMFK